MTLEEALAKTECDVLRAKLQKFCADLKENFLPGTACPVCGTDIRSSYNPSHANPWRGNCYVCKLGLQVRHRIEHEGHLRHDGTLCAYEVNLPTALCSKFICNMLRTSWQRMGMPRRELTPSELDTWLTEVQSVTKSLTMHRA